MEHTNGLQPTARQANKDIQDRQTEEHDSRVLHIFIVQAENVQWQAFIEL